MTIVAIVPRLQPAIDGVGDYALNLALQMRKDFGVETHFIIADPKWKGETKLAGFSISQCHHQSSDELESVLAIININQVLLHYVNYGFSKRGCPIWLITGLRQWQTNCQGSLLTTMFHEISASGPPWTSAFWLSKLQRKLANQIALMSDYALTSKQLYADILLKGSCGKHQFIPTLPIFSGIGELSEPPLLQERQRNLVVFGGSASRQRVYRDSYDQLVQACQHLNIANVLDIGPKLNFSLPYINDKSIRKMGILSASEISDVLRNTVAGFIDYHPAFLAKSSIFAAYCSHKLLPINTKASNAPTDGLFFAQHYWSPNASREKLEIENMQTIADNAYTWYQTHNRSIHAAKFAAILNGGSNGISRK